MNQPLGKVQYTYHGFERIDFTDVNDKPCTLRQCTVDEVLSPCAKTLNLGVSSTIDVPMHLDRKQVEALVTRLQWWLDTGSFREPSEEEL
jgi:hypothetical protein